MCENGFVSFSRIAENRIAEAMARGDFDNLPGAGRPLCLEEYFSTPDALRAGFSILKNANCVPAEVELLNEVSRLEQVILETSDATARQALRRSLVDRQLQLAIMLERRPRRDR